MQRRCARATGWRARPALDPGGLHALTHKTSCSSDDATAEEKSSLVVAFRGDAWAGTTGDEAVELHEFLCKPLRRLHASGLHRGGLHSGYRHRASHRRSQRQPFQNTLQRCERSSLQTAKIVQETLTIE